IEYTDRATKVAATTGRGILAPVVYVSCLLCTLRLALNRQQRSCKPRPLGVEILSQRLEIENQRKLILR
ncbi:MAG: hypothetical protein PSV18_10910, partial [Methylobacter sp.]|nr:hypothetical protein [Candidatus Methylobacter titanis]